MEGFDFVFTKPFSLVLLCSLWDPVSENDFTAHQHAKVFCDVRGKVDQIGPKRRLSGQTQALDTEVLNVFRCVFETACETQRFEECVRLAWGSPVDLHEIKNEDETIYSL